MVRKAKAKSKGLLVSVLRDVRLGDCTNRGPSSKFKEFTLVSGEGKDTFVDGPFEPTGTSPALVLHCMYVRGEPYYYAVPASLLDKRTMAGGNFAYTSDGRFADATAGYPIEIHDRVE